MSLLITVIDSGQGAFLEDSLGPHGRSTVATGAAVTRGTAASGDRRACASACPTLGVKAGLSPRLPGALGRDNAHQVEVQRVVDVQRFLPA